MKTLRRAGYVGLIALMALSGYVRLAPTDPTDWHTPVPDFQAWSDVASWGKVVADTGSAHLRVRSDSPTQSLARLNEIALATSGTKRLAGSAEEGRITWITRSRFWGFPDFTTAEARKDGLYLFARLRFGAADLGVNAARLTAWRDQL